MPSPFMVRAAQEDSPQEPPLERPRKNTCMSLPALLNRSAGNWPTRLESGPCTNKSWVAPPRWRACRRRCSIRRPTRQRREVHDAPSTRSAAGLRRDRAARPRGRGIPQRHPAARCHRSRCVESDPAGDRSARRDRVLCVVQALLALAAVRALARRSGTARAAAGRNLWRFLRFVVSPLYRQHNSGARYRHLLGLDRACTRPRLVAAEDAHHDARIAGGARRLPGNTTARSNSEGSRRVGARSDAATSRADIGSRTGEAPEASERRFSFPIAARTART